MQVSLLYLTVLVVSTCGLVFELLAGTAGAYLLGESVTQFAAIIGLHLTMLGVGAWGTRHVDTHLGQRFVHCQLATALIGGATGPLLYLAFARTTWFRSLLFVLVGATGLFVGAQIPLLLRIMRRRVALAPLLARVFTVDYAGALIGSLVFVLVALPRLGLLRSGVMFGALQAVAALWTPSALGPAVGDAPPLRLRAYGVLAVLIGLFAAAPWFTRLADQEIALDPVVYARQTQYQRIVVTQTRAGINLFLDGNLQFAAADEYRYHEALVHPAMSLAPRRARVLVLGGGDGLAVRELLRYADVTSITLVDLDPGMTDLARHFAPLRALNRGSLDDRRVRVINDDAMVWLGRDEAPAARFDVAVVDFPDPNNFALGKLYTARFYRLLRAHLADDGVAVVQATSPLVARRSYWCVVRTIEAAGFQTRPFHALVPAFGEWGYVLATPRRFGTRRALPLGLRYVTEVGIPALEQFSPDMTPVPVEVNRLNNQVLVRYYEEEWRRLQP